MSHNGKINEHHNIPRSRGGSHSDVNKTKVLASRHDSFHDWAKNMTPCMIMRLLAINSVGLGGKSLPSAEVQELFKILTRRDWNLLYHPQGVRSVIEPRAIRYAHKIAENSIEHLVIERDAIQNALDTLEAVNPSRQAEHFLKCGLKFFGTDRPHIAIRKMSIERHDDVLCWVKPMVEATRTAVKDCMKSTSFKNLGHLDKHRLKEVLRHQKEHYIDRHIKEWEDELSAPVNGEVE